VGLLLQAVDQTFEVGEGACAVAGPEAADAIERGKPVRRQPFLEVDGELAQTLGRFEIELRGRRQILTDVETRRGGGAQPREARALEPAAQLALRVPLARGRPIETSAELRPIPGGDLAAENCGPRHRESIARDGRGSG
jgi:hypothetical protein